MPATERMPLEMKGADYIADTSDHTGRWFKIYAVTATVFNVLTITNITGTITSLPQGGEIYGNITFIDLTSGSIIAYKL